MLDALDNTHARKSIVFDRDVPEFQALPLHLKAGETCGIVDVAAVVLSATQASSVVVAQSADLIPVCVASQVFALDKLSPRVVPVSVRVEFVAPVTNPEAFNVVPDKDNPVPKVISSMTPVPAVPLPINLLVDIEVVIVRFAERSQPPDNGAVVEMERAGCTAVSARAREAIEALLRATVPVVVMGQPVNPAPVFT